MVIVNRIVKVSLVFVLVLFVTISCKKKKAFKEEDGQTPVDVRLMQGQNEEALYDINSAIMEQSLIRGRSSSEAETSATAATQICGVELDTSLILQGILKLNYLGLPCKGAVRTGVIVITIQNYPLRKWKNAGCVLKIDFKEFKATRLSDSKSIQFDGVQYLTNQSGNTFFELRYLNVSSLAQTLSGEGLTITFEGKNTAIFNVNRQMTYTYSNSVTQCRIEGLGSSNGDTNLESWGQTRTGDNFTSEVTSPIVWNSTCGAIKPIAGEVTLRADEKYFDLKCKFGLDSEGNELGVGGECPYGWKLTWSYKRKTSSRIFSY